MNQVAYDVVHLWSEAAYATVGEMSGYSRYAGLTGKPKTQECKQKPREP